MFFFVCEKLINAKDIHKEIFPVYGGKCLLRKAFHNWIEKLSQGRSKVADYSRSSEVAETTVKRLLRCWFRRTGKAMGQVYQCRRKIYQEINVFSGFEYHIFTDSVVYRRILGWDGIDCTDVA
jgi:hypothetical protein